MEIGARDTALVSLEMVSMATTTYSEVLDLVVRK
jgi:hypothetical protein